MSEQQPGEYIEQRLIGMLLVSPARILLCKELAADDFVLPLHWRIIQAIREVGADVFDLVQNTQLQADKGVGEYLTGLAASESFTPENIPAYVRVLKDISGQRAYQRSVGKLAATSTTKLFGEI